MAENEPDDPVLEWDASNQRHAADHGLTPAIAAEVIIEDDASFFENSGGIRGSFMAIGRDMGDHFWTIILLEVGRNVWRPITGWPSTRSQIERYMREA